MEWLGQLLASDVFRGSALLVAVVSGIAAITLQFLRNQPVFVKLDDENRKALDASVQNELTRLGKRLDECEDRHAECEERQVKLHRDFLARDREREEAITSLRRQIAQHQQTTIRSLRNQAMSPKGNAK